MNTDARLTAKLFSACPPDGTQKAKLEAVLSKKLSGGSPFLIQFSVQRSLPLCHGSL